MDKNTLIKGFQSLRYFGIIQEKNKILEIWRGDNIKITYPVNFRR